MGNYPDDVSPSSPNAPWNKLHSTDWDAEDIHLALKELNDLYQSIIWLNRRAPNHSRFVVDEPAQVAELYLLQLKKVLEEALP